MLKNKTFIKKTKRGGVIKVVREHYLRDDIPCGLVGCRVCTYGDGMRQGKAGGLLMKEDAWLDMISRQQTKEAEQQQQQFPVLHATPETSPFRRKETDQTMPMDIVIGALPTLHYIIPDTNVFLHQMDLMENPIIKNVIVLQTVLDELRHRHVATYHRVRKLVKDLARRFFVFSNEHHKDTHVDRLPRESPNDRNDRAIRVACAWYANHMAAHVPSAREACILFLSDDKENRDKASLMQDEAPTLLVCSVVQYVDACTANPELADVVANATSGDADDVTAAARSTPFEPYPEHKSETDLAAGLASGLYVKGGLCMSSYHATEGAILKPSHVLPHVAATSILLVGHRALNRAMHGDEVVVEVLPVSQWKRSEDDVEGDDDKDMDASERDPANQTPSDRRHADTQGTAKQQPTGHVVGILKRNRRPYCGSICTTSIPEALLKVTTTTTKAAYNVLFRPIDRRLPKIRFRTRQVPLLRHQRVVVAVDAWPAASRFPTGHFVRALGVTGERSTETEALLIEHDVAYADFSPAVMRCLPTGSWVVPERTSLGNGPLPSVATLVAEARASVAASASVASAAVQATAMPRIDLRALDVCSVDPPGCTDIDDALHVRRLDNGLLEVGVHIADVTHFVQQGTAMDMEAQYRSTSVYLVDRRIDMLPSLLGTNLCSLRSDVDRYAFSVLWEVDEAAQIRKTTFTKSIIRSKAAFTYDQAQARIESDGTDALTQSLKTLNRLAKCLRTRRMARGALTLASPEVRFALENDTQDPVDVEMKALVDANALVEEFMLLANISVARQISTTFPQCALLRRHQEPAQERFQPLKAAMAGFGLTLDTSSSKALARSLDAAQVPGNPFFNRLVRIATTRCMMQATYFCAGTEKSTKDYWHYGLATDIYTHFTSPIRRYADVVVHRMLYASLTGANVQVLQDKDYISDVCNNLNIRHANAQKASRKSIELFTYLFFKDKEYVDEEGFILRVLSSGIVVLVAKYGIEALVSFREDIAKGTATYEDALETGTGSVLRTKAHGDLRTFCRVKVRLSVHADTNIAMQADASTGKGEGEDAEMEGSESSMVQTQVRSTLGQDATSMSTRATTLSARLEPRKLTMTFLSILQDETTQDGVAVTAKKRSNPSTPSKAKSKKSKKAA